MSSTSRNCVALAADKECVSASSKVGGRRHLTSRVRLASISLQVLLVCEEAII